MLAPAKAMAGGSDGSSSSRRQPSTPAPRHEQRGRLADPRRDGGQRRADQAVGRSPYADRHLPVVGREDESAAGASTGSSARSASATPLAIVAWPQNGTSASGLK